MKIGLIRETKIPEDNRVAMTPKQAYDLEQRFPGLKIMVQSSPTRAYSDKEYEDAGLTVCDDVSGCDVLFGIKEAAIDTLIPNRHYFFFGHIAKFQEYNRPLLQSFLKKDLTFTDYEYLVDENGQRLVAFGWFAGIVGCYYTLRGWGMRKGTYTLPAPHLHLTKEEIIDNLRKISIGNIKILVTGTGRVSHGAQYILDSIGVRKVSIEEYLQITTPAEPIYCVAAVDELVKPRNGEVAFEFADFCKNPGNYESDFARFAKSTDILLSCHFWEHDQPVYLDWEDYTKPDFRIRMIGDITCDIQGSIKSTLRSSTHADPFFDYNPQTRSEQPAFSADSNVTVMAVDTCPNALPRETSEFFGGKLIEEVLTEMIDKGTDDTEIVDRATIVREGELNTPFKYLSEFAAGK